MESAPRTDRSRVVRGAGSFSATNLLSRVLGVGREMSFAYVFGAGHAVDAFVAAFHLPNLLRDLFAENATTAAVVPVYGRIRETRGRADARAFAGRILGTFTAAAAAVAAAGMLLAPWLALLIAPGFAEVPGKIDLTARLGAVMFPLLALVSAAAVLQGILQAEGVFWTTGIGAALFNVALIAAAFLLCPLFDEPIVGMAWAVLIGGTLQVAVQWGPLRRRRGVGAPLVAPRDPDVAASFRLLLPAVLGSSATIVMVYANAVFASFMGEGSVAYLSYAYRIMHLPLGLVGVAVGTAILPPLTEAAARGETARARDLTAWALRTTVGVTSAAAVAIALLAEPIVRLLFLRGAFGPEDAAATAAAVRAFAPTIVFGSAARVLSSGFYARHRSRVPAAAGAAGVAATILLNSVAVFLLHAPFWAVAAGVSAGSAVNCAVLLALRGRRA